jgi:hypothetical protein
LWGRYTNLEKGVIIMADIKVWTKEEIRGLLEANDEMVKRSLLAIYALQTEDEKDTESTKHHNSVGFNGLDSEILSSFSKQLLTKGYLSPKQMTLSRRKILKYSKQLADVANGKLQVNESDLKYKKS